MALKWIEGFEGYGDAINAGPDGIMIVSRYIAYVSYWLMDLKTGRDLNGWSLKIAYDHWVRRYLISDALTTDDTMVFGCAFQANVGNNGNGLICGLSRAQRPGMEVHVNADGTLRVAKSTGSGLSRANYSVGTLLGTSTGTISFNTWYYLELKVYSDASGTWDLRINGTSWASGSSTDTRCNGELNSGFFLDAGENMSVIYDDIYCLDSTGSYNNDCLGPQQVMAIIPDGMDTTGWTPSASTNNSCVDDGPGINTADYVTADANDEKDLYDYAAIASGMGEINGIVIHTETEVIAGAGSVTTVIKSGSEYDETSDNQVSGSRHSVSRLAERNPNGSAQWTESSVNAAQFGIKAST